MRLRAAIHEVGTGNEADEMAVFVDDRYGQEAMFDKKAKYVANGRIRRDRYEYLFHDIPNEDGRFFRCCFNRFNGFDSFFFDGQ